MQRAARNALVCLAVLALWSVVVSPALAASDPPIEAEPSRQLLGKWEAVDRSMGGIGTTLEFMADGSMAMSPGAMVDFDYQLSGNRLVATGRGEAGEPPVVQNYEVRFEGDQLIQKDLGLGVEMRMLRVGEGPPGEPTIVGVWRGEPASPDAPALAPELQEGAEIMARNTRWIFTADGRMLLRIPFRRDLGAYSVEGNTLVMRLEGEQTVRFRIEGDSLFLGRKGPADESEFRRVSW